MRIMAEETVSDWTVSVIRDFEHLCLMKNEWNMLLEESNYDTLHLRHEWLALVWKYYITFDKTAQLCVFCIRRSNNELIGILPLMTVLIPFKKIFKIRQLCFLGHDFNDYSGFIIKRGLEERVMTYFMTSILSNRTFVNWHVLLLKNLSDKSHEMDRIHKQFSENSHDVEIKKTTRYFYIKTDTGTFADYYQRLSKNFRNDLRKCQNRLDRYAKENESTTAILFNDDRIRNMTVFSSFAEWQINRMERVHKRSSFKNEAVRSFRYEFITTSPELVLTVTLNLNHNPIAFCICLIYKNTLFFWIHGSDPEYYFLSPNKIILGKIIEYCFLKEYKICDFSRGDHEYKEKWANEYHNGYLLRVYNARKPILKLVSRFIA